MQKIIQNTIKQTTKGNKIKKTKKQKQTNKTQNTKQKNTINKTKIKKQTTTNKNRKTQKQQTIQSNKSNINITQGIITNTTRKSIQTTIMQGKKYQIGTNK